MAWEDKRRYKRTYIRFPVEYRSKNTWQYVEARDISAGGMFIVTDKVEPAQTKVEVMFEFGKSAGRKSIHADAVVAWNRPKSVLDSEGKLMPPGMGIMFTRFLPAVSLEFIDNVISVLSDVENVREEITKREIKAAQHKILIVDDEENILNSLSRLLQDEGREVLVAQSSEEGLEKLKEAGEVGVVISDNRMPGMSGVDFLVKVRQVCPDAIRILLTGYADLESAVDVINKGQVYRYILKPWENEEMKLTLKYALDYYDVMRENRLLLRIARQQVEQLRQIQNRYPQVSEEGFSKEGLYSIEGQHVSGDLRDFLEKYYPEALKP